VLGSPYQKMTRALRRISARAEHLFVLVALSAAPRLRSNSGAGPRSTLDEGRNHACSGEDSGGSAVLYRGTLVCCRSEGSNGSGPGQNGAWHAFDKSARCALVVGTGKRSPREATCPRIASGFRQGRCMSAVYRSPLETLVFASRAPALRCRRWDHRADGLCRAAKHRERANLKLFHLNGGLP
jgi:hypothetical protein